MTRNRLALLPALALAVALLGACGSDDADTTTASSTTAETTEAPQEETTSEAPADGDLVTMEESRYLPDVLEVAAGTEVTFENTDPYAHTVTSAEGSAATFDSGELGQDETFEHTFDEAGTYEYFCEIHPTMRAEVVVS